ncbi:MAG: hypothetical protein LBO72_08115 [Helicobacteraceae bacterium]|jgi:hypothetical protein|nr:hypothetical protein [Helicobacteraceae bacterium]
MRAPLNKTRGAIAKNPADFSAGQFGRLGDAKPRQDRAQAIFGVKAV